MVTKILKNMEIKKGFIRVPVKKRDELLQGLTPPFTTKLNDMSAEWDIEGRIWCTKLLKNRFPINSEVILSRNGNGFEVKLNGQAPSNFDIAPILDEPPKLDTAVNIEINDCISTLPEKTVEPNETWQRVLEGDCIEYLNKGTVGTVDLTFFDPPYLQGKEYRYFDDNQSAESYWNWIKAIVQGVYNNTSDGGCLYFMHREKNAEIILRILRETGWNFQNLIIWKKKTSAVPIETRFSKQYQIIAYAIKGRKPRVFNKVRIDPPPLPEHKYQHENGVYLTDVWDDIRELTSGYFAGDEAFRDKEGNRAHVQQTPVALLLRIILSSSLPNDVIFDPTAGTGTALTVAKQLERNCIGIEIDPEHVKLIKNRLSTLRAADSIGPLRNYYRFTSHLNIIWQTSQVNGTQKKLMQREEK